MAAGPHGQIIRREGEYWTIEFEGIVCRLRDARGFQHLAYLLRHPHEEVASLALERRAGEGEISADVAALARTGGHEARERARVNVTRAISGVLRRIAAHHPALGAHLAATIRTGAACSYSPDPRLPIEWTE